VDVGEGGQRLEAEIVLYSCKFLLAASRSFYGEAGATELLPRLSRPHSAILANTRIYGRGRSFTLVHYGFCALYMYLDHK